jgi:hypothetical protein
LNLLLSFHDLDQECHWLLLLPYSLNLLLSFHDLDQEFHWL